MKIMAGTGGGAPPRPDPASANPVGPGRLARRLRVPVFTGATVALGVGAHLTAGGAEPAPGQLALISAVVALICSAVAGRERTLPALLGAVGLTELGIHVALLGQGHAVHPAGSARLLLAHVAASALLAWWLRRGEAAAWRVVDRVVSRGALLLAVRSAPALELEAPVRLPAGTRTRRPAPVRVGSVPPVRGPPCPA